MSLNSFVFISIVRIIKGRMDGIEPSQGHLFAYSTVVSRTSLTLPLRYIRRDFTCYRQFGQIDYSDNFRLKAAITSSSAYSVNFSSLCQS